MRVLFFRCVFFFIYEFREREETLSFCFRNPLIRRKIAIFFRVKEKFPKIKYALFSSVTPPPLKVFIIFYLTLKFILTFKLTLYI